MNDQIDLIGSSTLDFGNHSITFNNGQLIINSSIINNMGCIQSMINLCDQHTTETKLSQQLGYNFQLQPENKFTVQEKLNQLKEKYHQNKTVMLYLDFKAFSNIEDCFPENVENEDLHVFFQEENIMARVLFKIELFLKKKQNIQILQKSPLFVQIMKSEDAVLRGKQILQKYDLLGRHYEQRNYKMRFLAELGLFKPQLPNYEYYMNENKIGSLHKKEGNYQWLENRHDYIQWMFPNHFKSHFNSQASALSYFQVKLFKNSKKIGYLLYKSISIFLDFLGLKLINFVQIALVQEKRLNNALLINTHNHLRLRRFFCCLSVTGYRKICLSVIQFLRKFITQTPKYHKLKHVFEKQWEIYDQNHKEKALEMCFHPNNQFPKDHIFYQEILTKINNPKAKVQLQIPCKSTQQTVKKQSLEMKKQQKSQIEQQNLPTDQQVHEENIHKGEEESKTNQEQKIVEEKQVQPEKEEPMKDENQQIEEEKNDERVQ